MKKTTIICDVAKCGKEGAGEYHISIGNYGRMDDPVVHFDLCPACAKRLLGAYLAADKCAMAGEM